MRRAKGEHASVGEVDARVVDVRGSLRIVREHVEVDPVGVVLAMVVDERAVRVAAGTVDAGGGGRRLGNHVILTEPRHCAIVRHAGEDARPGDQRAERNVKLMRKVGRIGATSGQHGAPVNVQRRERSDLACQLLPLCGGNLVGRV